KKLRSAGLCVGAAAKSEHGGFFQLGNAAQHRAHLVRFDLPESRFAETLENRGDVQAGSFFDAVVEIDEPPGELAGEQRADGGLAGTHKAGEAKHLDASV